MDVTSPDSNGPDSEGPNSSSPDRDGLGNSDLGGADLSGASLPKQGSRSGLGKQPNLSSSRVNQSRPDTVREYSSQIMSKASSVGIDMKRLEVVAETLKDEKIEIPTWDHIHLQTTDFEEAAQYFLTLNAINYCFFHSANSPVGQERFSDGSMSGAELAAQRITDNWHDMRDPNFLQKIDESDLTDRLFKAKIPIPLVKERVVAFRELGSFLEQASLNENYFTDLFQHFGGDARAVAEYLPQALPSWGDPFLKRAQLFVGMLYGRMQNSSENAIDPQSLKKLTVFADYRVPQALVATGVMTLSRGLLRRIKRGVELPSGSPEEQEIRAGTILAGDMLANQLSQKKGTEINALHVDYLLWKLARDMKKGQVGQGILAMKKLPDHHKTITVEY